MGHPAAGSNLDPKSSLGSYSNLVFSRLAIDQKPAAQRALIGHLSAQAVPLFADQKQHSNGCAVFAQALTGCDLRRHNAFGVAGAAPVNIFTVLRRRNKWRHRIYMSGEDNLRRLLFQGGLHIEASMSNGYFVDGISQPIKLIIERRA